MKEIDDFLCFFRLIVTNFFFVDVYDAFGNKIEFFFKYVRRNEIKVFVVIRIYEWILARF